MPYRKRGWIEVQKTTKDLLTKLKDGANDGKGVKSWDLFLITLIKELEEAYS